MQEKGFWSVCIVNILSVGCCVNRVCKWICDTSCVWGVCVGSACDFYVCVCVCVGYMYVVCVGVCFVSVVCVFVAFVWSVCVSVWECMWGICVSVNVCCFFLVFDCFVYVYFVEYRCEGSVCKSVKWGCAGWPAVILCCMCRVYVQGVTNLCTGCVYEVSVR